MEADLSARTTFHYLVNHYQQAHAAQGYAGDDHPRNSLGSDMVTDANVNALNAALAHKIGLCEQRHGPRFFFLGEKHFSN